MYTCSFFSSMICRLIWVKLDHFTILTLSSIAAFFANLSTLSFFSIMLYTENHLSENLCLCWISILAFWSICMFDAWPSALSHSFKWFIKVCELQNILITNSCQIFCGFYSAILKASEMPNTFTSNIFLLEPRIILRSCHSLLIPYFFRLLPLWFLRCSVRIHHTSAFGQPFFFVLQRSVCFYPLYQVFYGI